MDTSRRNVITAALPDLDAILEALPDEPGVPPDELRARTRLAYLQSQVAADADELEAAIDVLRTRAAGDRAADPFGPRITAETFDALVASADRAMAAGPLDLPTVLALQFESGAIAARHGQRLILFLGVNAEVRRLAWSMAVGNLRGRDASVDEYVELGRWMLLWTEMNSLAVGEGYRATERELIARDVAARRAALDELLGAVSIDARAGARLRRLAMRYGLDPDASFRVAAVLPGIEADPTPDEPGIDDEDLDALARRIDHLIRRQSLRDGVGSGITAPLAISWRGSVVAILGPEPQEWSRLREAAESVLGPPATWTAVAIRAHGVGGWSHAMLELQEALRVATAVGRHGVIDDVAELGVERLLLSDPDLAKTIIDRELGVLLADSRMGEELVETLQVYFDAGGNRRETARRLHLADRTVAYRLERAEDLLGHGFDGDAGRRLNVALTLRRLPERGAGGAG